MMIDEDLDHHFWSFFIYILYNSSKPIYGIINKIYTYRMKVALALLLLLAVSAVALETLSEEQLDQDLH